MLRSLACSAAALSLVGCYATTGTMPERTFLLGDRLEHTCNLDSVVASTPDQAVVSALGCHFEVLRDCHAASTLASSLTGTCPMATHVVRGGHLEPLSLADYPLTGTFKGAYNQPRGPYQDYDTTFFLAQDGERVSGISKIRVHGKDLWGDLQVEGTLSGNVLFFRDVRLLDDNLPFYLAWCMKGGYMVVDPRDGHLHGPAIAPGCEPGTIDLRRAPDRPRVIVPGGDAS